VIVEGRRRPRLSAAVHKTAAPGSSFDAYLDPKEPDVIHFVGTTAERFAFNKCMVDHRIVITPEGATK
jgi:hypothetical protein